MFVHGHRLLGSCAGAGGSQQYHTTHGLRPVFLVHLTSTVLAVLLSSGYPVFAGTTYTKTTQLPPLRVSLAELQADLDKAASLLGGANGSVALWREAITLRKGELKITIAGHRLDSGQAKIPDTVDSFEYTVSTWDPTPISSLTLRLADYERSLSIEGQSPEQVDAIFSALREDLSKASAYTSGSTMKPFLACGYPTPTPAQTRYSRSIELPPLHTSFSGLQAVLDKAASLVRGMNNSAPSYSEETELRQGQVRVRLLGHQIEAENTQVPNTIDSFGYTLLFLGEPTAISNLSLNFGDWTRSLSVEGQSPEQVDAVYSALRDDLLKMAIPLGGPMIRSLRFPVALFLGVGTSLLAVIWFMRRRHLLLIPLTICGLLLLALLLLPIRDLLAGFSAIRGDPTFVVRYGPQFTFWGFGAGVLGILLSLLASLFGSAQKSEQVASSRPAKRTQKKQQSP